jgi:hypothetical protein
LDEREHILEFLLTASLKSRRVMKDEPWTVLKGELIANIVNTSLWHQISVMIRET